MTLKTKLLTFFTSATLLLNSCAIQTGTQGNSTELSQGNFEFVELVSAEAEASYFLGIGGLKKKALAFEAKKNLYKNHPLSKGKAYVT